MVVDKKLKVVILPVLVVKYSRQPGGGLINVCVRMFTSNNSQIDMNLLTFFFIVSVQNDDQPTLRGCCIQPGLL